MISRANVAKVLLAVGCAASVQCAALRDVDVTETDGRFKVVADTHLDAPPSAIVKVLLDFDHDRYGRISEIYKESGYLPPDTDGTPLVYTRVEGCLLVFCRSMRRVERLEVVSPNLIRSKALPERSDFKYSASEWIIEPEGDGTRVRYHMEMEPDFWLPPFVGPWFLKRTLKRGAPSAVSRIEQLAREDVNGATASVR